MATKTDISNLKEWIRNAWPATIRTNTEDSEDLIGVPYPYVVPCADGMFQEMYYWDTYYANQGLIRQGYAEVAKNNTDNMLYLVERYGFMPNGNRTRYLSRSQPPYLSMMVRDIYDLTRDKEWLRSAFATLKKEYEFWMTKRLSPIGLNRYGQHADDAYLLEFFYYLEKRTNTRFPVDNDAQRLTVAAHHVAECESGCDFNPRFSGRCQDHVPVELNSYLYMYEMNFAYFSQILANGEAAAWAEKAERRKSLLMQYCWNEEKGLFYEYDFVNGKQGQVEALAAYTPLWSGMVSETQSQRLRDNLHIFEYEFGLAVCSDGGREHTLQWDFPNGWPPLFYIAIEGLRKYGFHDDARRIAQKYVEVVVRSFKTTGLLWEKYNVVDGSTNVTDEYEMPPMLGWTAGVFLYAAEILAGTIGD